ncbi:ABC transporter permease [Fodinicola feengrottensis]|uniref:ABC transporter permease n=1 Tax=Fodinicola feengrottensis TaxID=435914 RepID=A0ABN2GYP2_9ACTN
MTTVSNEVPIARRANAIIWVNRLREMAMIPVIVVLMIVGFIIAPDTFLSVENLMNVLQQQSELSLLVLAEACILITGRFDLSLESTIGLAPALGLLVPMYFGLPTVWAVPICLGVGILIGVFNGTLVVRFGLNAFIVTLGMLIVLRGLQTGTSAGKSLFQEPASFSYLGSASWFGIPVSILVCIAAYAIGIVTLRYFRAGRALYAIGGNVDAARAAGIRTGRTVWGVYAIGGFLAALAGVMMAGRLGSVAASQGNGMIFTVFAAAVIGGISLNGGRGTLFGALCGVIVLGLIQNILLLAGVDPLWNPAINGAIILVALILTRLTSGKSQN